MTTARALRGLAGSVVRLRKASLATTCGAPLTVATSRTKRLNCPATGALVIATWRLLPQVPGLAAWARKGLPAGAAPGMARAAGWGVPAATRTTQATVPPLR